MNPDLTDTQNLNIQLWKSFFRSTDDWLMPQTQTTSDLIEQSFSKIVCKYFHNPNRAKTDQWKCWFSSYLCVVMNAIPRCTHKTFSFAFENPENPLKGKAYRAEMMTKWQMKILSQVEWNTILFLNSSMPVNSTAYYLSIEQSSTPTRPKSGELIFLDHGQLASNSGKLSVQLP